MKETLSNIEMDNRLKSLESLLDHMDMVGYVAARNYRRIEDQNKEYQRQKEELIKKYGREENGGIRISPEMPEWDSFVSELMPFAEIKHEVEIYTMPMNEAAGLITGREIIECGWMFTED